MIIIQLTKGYSTKVDDDFILNHKWQASVNREGTVWAVRNEISKTILLHREIMGLKNGDKKRINHINKDTLDNRRENLRLSTLVESAGTIKKQKNKSSKYKGVSFCKKFQKWRAYIGGNKTRKYLGSFDNENDAHAAYREEAKIRFGKNFVG